MASVVSMVFYALLSSQFAAVIAPTCAAESSKNSRRQLEPSIEKADKTVSRISDFSFVLFGGYDDNARACSRLSREVRMTC